MPIFNILIMKYNSENDPIVLTQIDELSSFNFWQRGTIKEITLFVSREAIQRTPKNEKQSIIHSRYVCHCYVDNDNLACTLITDLNYPKNDAYSLILTCLAEFKNVHHSNWYNINIDSNLKVPILSQLIKQHQNPSTPGKANHLEDNIPLMSIHWILKINENLEMIVDRSKDLSFYSKRILYNYYSKKVNN